MDIVWGEGCGLCNIGRCDAASYKLIDVVGCGCIFVLVISCDVLRSYLNISCYISIVYIYIAIMFRDLYSSVFSRNSKRIEYNDRQ